MQYLVSELATNVYPTAHPRELLEREKTYKGRKVVRVSRHVFNGEDCGYDLELTDG